jgi:hypothetical protein
MLEKDEKPAFQQDNSRIDQAWTRSLCRFVGFAMGFLTKCALFPPAAQTRFRQKQATVAHS